MTETMDPQALVLGAGLMGRWHGLTLRRSGIRVGHVVDPDLERAEALASDLPGCNAAVSLDEIERMNPGSVAHICTPMESHAQDVEVLLDADFHVICEKPLVGTATETEGLLKKANAVNRLLCPVHQFPYQNGFLKALEGTRDAGEILHIDAVACSAGAISGTDQEKKNVASDILPHPLSLFQRILKDEIQNCSWRAVETAPGEVRASGYNGNTSLALIVSMEGRPTRNTLRIICQKGTFHVDLFHGFSIREGHGVSRANKIMRPFSLAASTFAMGWSNLAMRTLKRETAYPGLGALFASFYARVNGRGVAPYTPEEILGVAVARDQILEQLPS